MKNTYSILSALLLMVTMTFLASCSKEESVTLTPIIESDVPPEEKVDFFFLYSSNPPFQTEFNSAYVSCASGDGSFKNFIFYGADLEAFNELNFLTWTTTEPLSGGEYLVEGFSEELDSTILFDLFINYDNEILTGEFVSHDESLRVSGYFQTYDYTCEQIGPDWFFPTEFTKGRVTHTVAGKTEIHTAVSTFCDEIDAGTFGTFSFNIILAGDIIALEEGELIPEVDPEFLLFTEFDEPFELGKTYTTFYLPETEVDVQNIDNIEELLFQLQQIGITLDITFNSVENGFTTGEYSGTDPEGRNIEGQFRAELYACN